MLRSLVVRFVFSALWFFIVPALVAYGLLSWLSSPGVNLPFSDFAREQSVPAGIALFTLLELVLYSFRHRLPLARFVSVAGREGVPLELRAELEQTLRLIADADAVLSKHGKAIRAALGSAEHDALVAHVETARGAVRADPIDPERLHEAHANLSEVMDQRLSRWKKNELLEYGGSIITALAVALLLRALVVEAFKIPSGSMLPTLQIGDHIFVNKFVYGPQIPFLGTRAWDRMPPHRGDIIVFSHPASLSPDDLIKRVIALPGDVLEVDSGHPIINGWRVPSCSVGSYVVSEDQFGPTEGDLFVEYLEGTAYLAFYDADQSAQREGPFQVRPGEVWVMGDNRHHSADSRKWPNPNGGLGRGVPEANIKGRAMIVWAPLSRMFTDLMGSPVLPDGAPLELLTQIADCLAKRPSPADTVPPARKAALQAWK